MHVSQWRVGAPSMVYGPDLLANLHALAGQVRHIEILLFETPRSNNIPDPGVVADVARIAGAADISLSVHLPTSLEPASANRGNRRRAVERIAALCRRMDAAGPTHYVLHVPFGPPTLVCNPAEYRHGISEELRIPWMDRFEESMDRLAGLGVSGERFLLENINYSPFLVCDLVVRTGSGLCLDVCHLLLGDEYSF